MNNNYAISIKNVTKTYKLYDKPVDRLKESVSPFRKVYHKEFYALNDITLQVKKGETIGLIGKNGSGKSTLLKLITGVLSRSEGSISTEGTISSLLELGAGLNPEYTGVENIYFYGTIMGYNKKQIDEKVDDIIGFADVGEFINQPVKMYSSGMFARLAFAIAVNVDPEILIIDEALSVGDIAFQAKCYAKFRQFQELGKTIIFVSHDLDVIIKYCSRVIVLNSGRIVFDGLPKEAVDIYKKIMVDAQLLSKHEDEILKNSKAEFFKEQTYSKYFSISPVCEIYGNGKANIVDFGVFDDNNFPTQKLISGNYYTFKMKVSFNDNIENPIFTYTIRDMSGQDITGTNTLYQNLNTGIYHINDVVTVEFKQQLNLNSGNYMLTFACSGFEGEQFVVYERLYHILILQVISFEKIVGFFSLNSDIVINQIKGSI